MVQPDFPVFAPLDYHGKEEDRSVCTGTGGTLMGEQNGNDFSPVAHGPCRQTRAELECSGASCAPIPYGGTGERSQSCGPARACPEHLLFVFISYSY